MKKNITIKTTFLILLGIIIIPSFISAEDSEVVAETNLKNDIGIIRPQPPRPEIKNMRVEARSEIKEIRQDNKEERNDLLKEKRDQIKNVRQNASSTMQRPTAELKVLHEQNKVEIGKIRADFFATIKTNKASTTSIIKEKREDLIKGIQEKRDLFKEELENKKELRASTTAAMKLKFKESLGKIKDDKKKIKVENVADNVTELNTKITTKSVESINKIEEVLIAIESRADKATANGIDVSNIRALIATAEVAISDARNAITNQTGKTYTVSIVDESTVKTSLKNTRDLLKKDIDAMNVSIKTAHESVRKTATALKSIPKVDIEVTTTETSSTTTN